MLEQHGRDNLYRFKGVRGWAYTVTKKVSEKIKKSKDGKQNIRDSGLANLSNKEVSREQGISHYLRKKGSVIKQKKRLGSYAINKKEKVIIKR